MQVIDQKHACHLLKNANHPPKNTSYRQDIGDIDDETNIFITDQKVQVIDHVQEVIHQKIQVIVKKI